MLTFLASASPEWTKHYADIGEQMSLGVTMMLVGIVIVVALLIVIMLAIELLPLLFGEKKAKKSKIATPSPTVVVPVQAADGPVVTDNDNGILAAVIAAAVSAYTASAGTPTPGKSGFYVRRIRRIG